MVFVCESISRNSFTGVFNYLVQNPLMFWNNVILFFLIGLIPYLICSLIQVSAAVMGLFFIPLASLNFIKLTIRKEPIFPWDLFIIGDAADISGQTEMSWNGFMIGGIIFLVAAIVPFFIPRFRRFMKVKIRRRIRNLAAAATFAVMILFAYLVFLNQGYLNYNGVTINQWEQDKSYAKNGFIPSLIMNIRFINIEKPGGYNKSDVTAKAGEIQKSEATETPNLIVIMSESFADFTSASNLTFNDPVMPTVDWLRDYYISGNILTPAFAGSTANVEFEALTGFSNAFLPTGCTPYQQLITKPLACFPRFLTNNGYSTRAIHTFGRRFWNRDNVYQRMGFEQFIASNNFVNPYRERKLISDYELTNRIIEEYEDMRDTSGKPAFIFAVSVQNHGSYRADQYEEEMQFNMSGQNINDVTFGKIRSYITGINRSDDALWNLIHYFMYEDEPTIIAFFGDHFPQFGSKYQTFNEIGYTTSAMSEMEREYMMHITPFVVWNNFSQYKKTDVNISAYQVLPFLTEEFGMIRPAFFDYLNEQRRAYAGNALEIYLDGSGNLVSELSEEAKRYMQLHRLFQYDLLGGKGYAESILMR